MFLFQPSGEHVLSTIPNFNVPGVVLESVSFLFARLAPTDVVSNKSEYLHVPDEPFVMILEKKFQYV